MKSHKNTDIAWWHYCRTEWETSILITYTCTHQEHTDTIEALKTHSHTLLTFNKSARKIILCFWCPSQYRDLRSLSEELLGNAAPLPRNPVILKDTAIHPMQKKKLSGAPVVSMKLADQVKPLIPDSAHPVNRPLTYGIWTGGKRIFQPWDNSYMDCVEAGAIQYLGHHNCQVQ